MKSNEEITVVTEAISFKVDKETETSDLHSMEVHDHFYGKSSSRKNFLSSEEIQINLHNEIVTFSSEIEEFNEINKTLFKDLIDKMTEAIQKILPDSIVKIS